MIVPLFDKTVKLQLMKIDEFQSQYLSIDYFQSFTICRNRNRDGTTNQKETGLKRDLWVPTIVIMENYGKPYK